MPIGVSTTVQDPHHSVDEVKLRKKAVMRSWVCPGAGFALIGKRGYATAAYVASLSILPVVAWIAFRPNSTSLWTIITITVVISVLWLAEQAAIKKATHVTKVPSFLNRGFILCTCAFWLAAFLALGLFITSFGSLKMAGSGMMPTLEESERLFDHKLIDVESIKPGAIVVYRNAEDSAWGQPGWLVISRILAGPGDNIAIQNGKYVVNGTTGSPVAEIGRYDLVLKIPDFPNTILVPPDCYFIVQDSPSLGLDSRALSWVRTKSIVGSRLWYLSGRGICKPVK